ncbi:hypothetical protein M430DRAFT_229603 [Amorphotheca resinae ATCC 22711]|uniref:Uncharacterized protein n=1 Tax=Amorphotheca resinae ATCC 22711 TaxID=857342 RepID=A0A2T3B390_AMORE|nr:hypothetical protein M430DRAFT_229603 [Amorphotheca resinae ATCC 22711]PSS20116.1 hypothetical protein M430DRAFT_229603 [Amorphotheca resinae ATCC 22711]
MFPRYTKCSISADSGPSTRSWKIQVTCDSLVLAQYHTAPPTRCGQPFPAFSPRKPTSGGHPLRTAFRKQV